MPAIRDDPGKANVVFSFKFFDEQTEDFVLEKCGDQAQYMDSLLCRLRDVGTMTLREFVTNNSQALKSNKINWDAAAHGGFPRIPRAYQEDALSQAREFSLSRNEHGRVHGFMVGNVFYIVWLDPEHKLFP